MTPSFKRALLLLIVAGLAGLALMLGRYPWPLRPPPAATPKPPPALSALADIPDWTTLNAFHHTITRADFERLLTTVFTTGGAWRKFIELDDAEARIRTGDADSSEVFHLRFALPGQAKPTPRQWQSAAQLAPAPAGKPLAGMRIAIDPGHVGGPWAQLEERWLAVGDGPPICEGDLTLTVARLLQPRLEALGATVSLVRSKSEPVTPLRPESLLTLARDSSDPAASPAALQKLAERLFYRTAEIRARAQLVNQTLKPDLVLCLHFNADPWGDPRHPTLVTRNHLHLLLNGAYTDDEVALADQRFAMLEKLLRRTHEEEALVAVTVADSFAAGTGLPPFVYPAGARNALPVNGHPYLWARNLLANRLYDCPVIFLEPYVMNSTLDYPRLQAGDYAGLRQVNGTPQPSIFREYAAALTDGLARHYAGKRRTAN
jgi:N-acetylmuramoyl-L-alanine amidase